MSLTPLYVPPPRPSPRPPEERRSEQPVLHRHQAAAIDAERLKLNEERAQLAREKEEFERRRQAVARESEARAQRQEQPVHDAQALAARIVEMGRIRRSEIPYRGTELVLPMAQAIIAAAAKARSTLPPDPELPGHPLAKAIVLCGQKARNTIDAAGERWLEDYFGKLESTRELMR